MLSAFINAISAWPWSMLAAFVAVCTFSVVFYANILRPLRRLRDLVRPVAAYFVIPSRTEHDCDFAKQDGDYHLAKAITLPAQSAVLIDLVLFPKLHFTSSEIYFGCEGGREVRDRPYAVEYVNRFIEVGAGRTIKPGDGSSHYIDKHHYYHVKDVTQWSVGGAKAVAFKIVTHHPGRYPVKIFLPGDVVEGVSDDLRISVEEYPTTRMHCIRPEHMHMPCAVGICPVTSVVTPG
jgi:hypothetical protein